MLVVPPDELAIWSPAAPGVSAEAYAADVAKKLRESAADLFEMRLNYNVVPPTDVRASADGVQAVRLEVEYPPPEDEPVKSVQVFSNLVTKLSANHQQVLSIQDARLPSAAGGVAVRQLAWLTLTPQRFTAFVEMPESPAAGATATMTAAATQAAPPDDSGGRGVSLVATHARHFLAGYNRLLLVAALLLVCATFWMRRRSSPAPPSATTSHPDRPH